MLKSGRKLVRMASNRSNGAFDINLLLTWLQRGVDSKRESDAKELSPYGLMIDGSRLTSNLIKFFP